MKEKPMILILNLLSLSKPVRHIVFDHVWGTLQAMGFEVLSETEIHDESRAIIYIGTDGRRRITYGALECTLRSYQRDDSKEVKVFAPDHVENFLATAKKFREGTLPHTQFIEGVLVTIGPNEIGFNYNELSARVAQKAQELQKLLFPRQ